MLIFGQILNILTLIWATRVESVTAHSEKGAWTNTALYVGQEEEQEVQEEGEEEVVGAGGGEGECAKGKNQPWNGEGEDGWLLSPTPPHNTCCVCLEHPESKLHLHSLCTTRKCVCGMASPLSIFS